MLGAYLVQILLHNLLNYSRLLKKIAFLYIIQCILLKFNLKFKSYCWVIFKLIRNPFSDLASAVFLQKRQGYQTSPHGICQSSMFVLMTLAASLLLLGWTNIWPSDIKITVEALPHLLCYKEILVAKQIQICKGKSKFGKYWFSSSYCCTFFL